MVCPRRRYSGVLGREGGEEVGEPPTEIARGLPLGVGVTVSGDGPRIGGRPLSDRDGVCSYGVVGCVGMAYVSVSVTSTLKVSHWTGKPPMVE